MEKLREREVRATPDPTGRTGTRTHARTHALNNVQSEPLSKAARKGLKRLNVGTCSSMTLASGFELQLSGRSPCVCTSAFTVICTHSGTAHICWNKPRGRTASRPRSGGRFGRAGGRTGPPAVRTGPGGSPCGPEPLRIQKLSRKTGADSSSSPHGNVGSHFRMQKKQQQTNKQAAAGPSSGSRSGVVPATGCPQSNRVTNVAEPESKQLGDAQRCTSDQSEASEEGRGQQMRLHRPSVVRPGL